MTKALIQRLGIGAPTKESLGEMSDHRVNSIKDVMKALQGHGTLPERYVEGNLTLELNLRIGSDDPEVATQDFVAIFQRALGNESLLLDSSDISDWRELRAGICDLGVGQSGVAPQDRPVFVFVGKQLESAKGMTVMAIPSQVRLEFPDRLDSARMNPSEKRIPARQISISERGDIGHDRECIRASRLLSVGSNELPNEIVKGGTQVLDKISDQQTPLGRRVFVDMDPEDVARFLHVYFAPEEVGFLVTEELPHLLVQSSEMRFGSVQL